MGFEVRPGEALTFGATCSVDPLLQVPGAGRLKAENHIPQVEGAAGTEHPGGVEQRLLFPEVRELVQGRLRGNHISEWAAMGVVKEAGAVPVRGDTETIGPRLSEGEHFLGDVHPVGDGTASRGLDKPGPSRPSLSAGCSMYPMELEKERLCRRFGICGRAVPGGRRRLVIRWCSGEQFFSVPSTGDRCCCRSPHGCV